MPGFEPGLQPFKLFLQSSREMRGGGEGRGEREGMSKNAMLHQPCNDMDHLGNTPLHPPNPPPNPLQSALEPLGLQLAIHGGEEEHHRMPGRIEKESGLQRACALLLILSLRAIIWLLLRGQGVGSTYQ